MSERDVGQKEQGAGAPPPRTRFRLARLGFAGTLLIRLANFRADLGEVFERELEAGRGFLWLPVLFGLGTLGYFSLTREPSAIALVAVTAALVAGAVIARRRIVAGRVFLILTVFLAGATAMKLRTDWVAAPLVPREMTATITGWVSAREATAKGGSRVTLRVASMERVATDRLPRTVRVTLRGKSPIAVGDAISVVARVQPPSGPALPGGYDFALAAFYTGIGGIGFAYGNAKPADLGPAPIDIRFWAPLAALRETIRERIVSALPGEPGAIAAALIMGDQGGVSEATQDDMRASGLGHVLSISGLHMALVAGWTFWVLRALFALSPALALRRPIKKWAALGALGAATFYLGLSGGGVATDRSYIMLAIMLIAILLDRRALTLRNVALAAIAILVFYPESILSVSFQMSFAATIALVAGYEAITWRSERSLGDPGAGFALLPWVKRHAIGLALTSVLAGLATTPFGLYHFQRAAPLSLLANVIAMPVVGTLVMMMAIPVVILMPFGLEYGPLVVMGWGIDWMTLVAREASAWSEGLGGTRMFPALALLLFVAGFLWLTLWQERWRLAGIIPMLAAVPIALSPAIPDVLVAADGRSAAVRGTDGHYRILGQGDNFVIETWLRADADARTPEDPSLKEVVRCDSVGCTASLPDGRIVALSVSAYALEEDCTRAAVVVSPHRAPTACADHAFVIDRLVSTSGGAVALYQGADSPQATHGEPTEPAFAMVSAYPAVRRPFMPPVRGQ